jgi:hypothetical protein
LKTECKSKQIEFQGLGKREVIGKFDGGSITSDAGGLLLRETEKRTAILKGFSECFTDFRDKDSIEHTVLELVSQRVYGLALGYEDLNDHDMLRQDPLLAVLCEKPDPTGCNRKCPRDKGKALAGKSTLNRLELTRPDADAKNRYKKIVAHPGRIDNLFVDAFLQSYGKKPKQIILDIDATDDPLHGNQEGRFFHGYYKSYCYLPLYIFCEDHLLCARLRPSNIDAAFGTVEELQRMVTRIRDHWPKVKIIIRGDSGFCREDIMSWCEGNKVEYILGFAKNTRLKKIIKEDLIEAEFRYRTTGRASRVYDDFIYKTRKSWSRSRRVISKAEYLKKGANPRFVVTSISKDEVDADFLYEKLYCARGEMENRIKEQQLYLFSDRTSTSQIRSNQIRLYFSSIAYLLVSSLRRLGLKGTRMAKAQCHTIRLKLLKIGAQLNITVRKVWVSLSEGYPYQEIFMKVYRNLINLPLPAW